MTRLVASTVALFSLTLAAAIAQPGGQPGAKSYGFLTHAAFFSLESRQANLIDPQAFVADASSAAATGPQGSRTQPASGRRSASITRQRRY